LSDSRRLLARPGLGRALPLAPGFSQGPTRGTGDCSSEVTALVRTKVQFSAAGLAAVGRSGNFTDFCRWAPPSACFQVHCRRWRCHSPGPPPAGRPPGASERRNLIGGARDPTGQLQAASPATLQRLRNLLWAPNWINSNADPEHLQMDEIIPGRTHRSVCLVLFGAGVRHFLGFELFGSDIDAGLGILYSPYLRRCWSHYCSSCLVHNNIAPNSTAQARAVAAAVRWSGGWNLNRRPARTGRWRRDRGRWWRLVRGLGADSLARPGRRTADGLPENRLAGLLTR
jgi:hypothetical protein